MARFKASRSSSQYAEARWTKHSEAAFSKVYDNNESLQKEDKRFEYLTGFTWNLIRQCPTLESECLQRKPLTAKVSPENIFCLIDIPVVGKFGAFYQGFEKTTWKPLTLKIFKPRIFANGRSRREKQILSLPNKPSSVPRFLAAFTYEFQNCFVFEYMPAKSLHDKLLFCRRFPPNVVLFFTCDMVTAVSFLHSKGLIHRNITLNVFWINIDGHLKLVDYTRCISEKSMFMKQAKQWSTIDYMAPEQLSGRRITKAVDMWALGVIFYRMITGRQPFYASTKKQLIQKIKEDAIECNYRFSQPAADFCRQLLQKEPNLRLGHAGETYRCACSHPYFDGVTWAEVLSGTNKAPAIPVLMSAESHALSDIRPLDFRASANEPRNLKKKPLLLMEISTKSVSEVFNQHILDINHAANIAKYQHEKKNLTLARIKNTEKFSFQSISQNIIRKSLTSPARSPAMTPMERSPKVSINMSPSATMRESSATPASASLLPILEYTLSHQAMKVTLEKIWADVVNDFEGKIKQGTHALQALEELQEIINKKLDEIKATHTSANTNRQSGSRNP